MSKRNLGVVLMLLFAVCYSAMQVAVKLSSNKIPIMEQVFVRNFMNMCLVFFLIRKKKVSFFGERKYQLQLFVRDCFSFLGIGCLFYASARGNQADITILNKMSPFFVTIFASIFLKEKLSKVQVPALILAFGGAFLVSNPSFGSASLSLVSNLGFGSTSLPLVAAFLSAVTTGVSYTLLSYFKDKVDGLSVIMHFATFSVVCSIPFMIGNFVVPTGWDLVALLLVGVFGTLGQILLTYAYRLAPASYVSIYNYAGILFSMLMGYFILQQDVGINSIIGGGMIVFASLIVYLYNQRRSLAG